MKKLDKVKASIEQAAELEIKRNCPKEAQKLAAKYVRIGWTPQKAIIKAKHDLLIE